MQHHPAIFSGGFSSNGLSVRPTAIAVSPQRLQHIDDLICVKHSHFLK
jgi:hypothetical protein